MMVKAENIQCPVCGYDCLGNGGRYCINKPKLVENIFNQRGHRMKKPEITKGEWQINRHSSTTIENIHQRTVCSTGAYQSNLVDHTEENQANAKAISAVPEMIEALILCKEVLLLASIWDKLSDDRKEDFDLAETAIVSALIKAGCTE